MSTLAIITQQATLTQETPTPNSPVLGDTWTPVSSGTVFTASSKTSRGGYGHNGDLFRHPIVGNAVLGSVLQKTIASTSDTYDQVTLTFQTTLTQETPTPNSPVLDDTWTPVSSGTVFTASSKTSRGGYGHNGDLFRHPIIGNAVLGSVLDKTLVFYQGAAQITTKQIAGVADIRVSTTQTISGRGSIGVLTAKTITGQADLRNFRTQSIIGAGSVQITSTKTISGQSDIGVISSKTISGQSDVRGFTTKTLSGAGDIRKSTTKTISGQSDIGAIITQIIQGTADLKNHTIQTLPGAGDIQNQTTHTITGQSFLVFRRTQTITGESFLVFKRDRTITGAGDVIGNTTQSLSGAGCVARISLRSLVGFSLIVDSSSQTITGTSDIKAHSIQTLPGAGDIQNQTTQTITGAGFCQPPIQRIFGRADIQANVTKTISGASLIIVATTPPTTPASLMVTGTGAATLSWSASTDAAGVALYLIERTTCPGTSGFTQIATVSGSILSYFDNAGPGCWCYRVRAQNVFGTDGGYSPVECVTLTLTTTNQNISGQGCLQLPTQQDINGQALMTTSFPSVAVRLTQVNKQVSENKFPNVFLTQASLMASESRIVNVNLTQAVLQVAMVYLGSYNHSFPGGTNNRGQG